MTYASCDPPPRGSATSFVPPPYLNFAPPPPLDVPQSTPQPSTIGLRNVPQPARYAAAHRYRTQALTQLDHVHFLKISGAPPEEVEELVSEKLGTNVVDISDSLFGLMEELCTGNPLMITELVSHLKVGGCGGGVVAAVVVF